jgi:hypothetical protein
MKYFFTLIALFGTYGSTQAQTIALSHNRLPQTQNWSHFSGRYNGKVQMDKQEYPIIINVRMKRDSIVWFTVNFNAGVQIPVAKGILLNDTLKLALLQPNKEYYEIPVAEASKYLSMPISVNQLQRLFTGQPLVDTCSPQPLNNSQYSAKHSQDLFCYNTLINGLMIQSKFAATTKPSAVEATAFTQLKETEISSPSNEKDKAILQHTDWVDVATESNNAFSFLPMAIKLKLTSAQDTAQVDLSLTTARYDAIPSYPFKIDETFTRKTLPLK